MKYKKQLFGDPFVNQFIAEMEGQRYHTRPYAWTDGENQYSHISGAITMPGMDMAGYLVTMGVRFDDNTFECIEEFQSEDEFELIKKACDIHKDYGCIDVWYGNPEGLMSIVNEVSEDYLPISYPADHNLEDAFQVYVARIHVSLREGKKFLKLNNCAILRNNFLSFVKAKGKPEHSPVLYAAGGLVHSLMVARPWEYAVEKTELIPTTRYEYSEYQHRQNEKEMLRVIYG